MICRRQSAILIDGCSRLRTRVPATVSGRDPAVERTGAYQPPLAATRMRRRSRPLIVWLAMLVALAPWLVGGLPDRRLAHAQDVSAAQRPTLIIERVAFDADSRTLRIHGSHFGDRRPAQVRLDREPLAIVHHSAREIVTEPLPKHFGAGNHVLAVIAGDDPSRFDVAILTLAASPETGSPPTPATPRQANALATLDQTGDVGWFTSLAIGRDDRPLISYLDYTRGSLKLAHCSAPRCRAADLTSVDTDGNVGWFSSLAIGQGGNPVIGYYDNGRGALKLALCHDPSCADAETRIIDADGDVGQHASLAIDPQGRAVIGYYDRDRGDLKVARCDDRHARRPASSGSTTSVTSAHTVLWRSAPMACR